MSRYIHFCALCVVVLGAFILSYSVGINSWWHSRTAIHDDACTLAHSFTIGLDFDLDYMNEVSVGKYAKSYKGTPPVPPGIGVLSSPFVAAFSIIDRLLGHEVIHDHAQYFDSWSFFAVGFASSFYFLAGVLLYYVSIRQNISLSPSACFIFCSGTGILFYVLMRPLMAHSFEFFNYSLIYFSSVSFVNNNKKRYIFLASLGVALAWLTRLHAIFPILLPIIIVISYNLVADVFNGHAVKFFIQRYALFLSVCFTFAVMLMFGVYGGFAPKLDSYGNVHTYVPVYTNLFDFLGEIISLVISRCKLISVILFGSSFPLWCYMPIAFFGIGGLFTVGFVGFKRQIELRYWWGFCFLLIFLYIIGPVSAVLLWRMPGSAYGFRYLFPLVPLGFLGMSLVLLRDKGRHGVFKKVFVAVLVCTSLFGSFAPIAFNTNPYWGYSYSSINEFGLEEGVNARDNIYRTIAWMENPGFFKVALSYGSSFAFKERTSSSVLSKQSFVTPSTYYRIYIMYALWLSAIACLFFVKNINAMRSFSIKDSKPYLLGSILFGIILHCMFLYYQSQPETKSKLLDEISEVNGAIQSSHIRNGNYTVENDFRVLKTWGENINLVYKSNGIDYKLIVLNAPDSNMVTLFHPTVRDPARPWWAYGYWTDGARSW